MKNSFYLAVFAALVFGGVVLATIRFNQGNGIITVPGWEHGVVICGEAVVINHGHERDYEFQELLDLADVFCPKS